MSDQIISQLVDIHGEGGLSPTRADWQAIFALPGRVRILNLLAFEDSVETDQGRVTGAEAYAAYAAAAGPVFQRVGGQREFFGPVAHLFHLNAPGTWDAAIMTLYPSAAALAEMWLDADYVVAHTSRASGLRQSQVLIFDGGTG